MLSSLKAVTYLLKHCEPVNLSKNIKSNISFLCKNYSVLFTIAFERENILSLLSKISYFHMVISCNLGAFHKRQLIQIFEKAMRITYYIQNITSITCLSI